ncbi:A-kinase-interacting protein 1 isoform X2 [Podarcis raffonei]|uniref:A-kinase-interacting protein 1 isoform X2 n=1 Tax=Podarcis raffonei TaxID=65483 RepID=UPI0023299634|nr:A-kinase-interacting protein 1 isoform X2 [Podarcis raffonei]
MESQEISLNRYRMQRTATLAQEVLERARTRKLNWPLPATFERRAFQEGEDEDACLAAAFASVAEHMGHISAECENYYCCVPPFQFKEYEVAHIFRYHSRESSANLLKAFENEESKNVPIVEEPGCPDTDTAALIPAENAEHKIKDIYIEVSPGTYTVSASSYDNTVKQTHLVDVRSGESVNLTFDL